MPKQEHVQKVKKQRERLEEDLPETQGTVKKDYEALLAEIDDVLKTVDQELAVNFVQQGGE